MEQTSPVEIIEAQIRECFGRVAWSHKTQEKCADILLARQNTIKIWQIILSAITTTGILAAVYEKNQFIGILSAIISTILLVLNTITKNYDLGGSSQKHAASASHLWNVRERYLSLLTDIRSSSITIEEIRKRRDDLQEQLYTVYKGSPRTISKAYKEATIALKKNEELTFSDAEIDALLPSQLRKNK